MNQITAYTQYINVIIKIKIKRKRIYELIQITYIYKYNHKNYK